MGPRIIGPEADDSLIDCDGFRILAPFFMDFGQKEMQVDIRLQKNGLPVYGNSSIQIPFAQIGSRERPERETDLLRVGLKVESFLTQNDVCLPIRVTSLEGKSPICV